MVFISKCLVQAASLMKATYHKLWQGEQRRSSKETQGLMFLRAFLQERHFTASIFHPLCCEAVLLQTDVLDTDFSSSFLSPCGHSSNAFHPFTLLHFTQLFLNQCLSCDWSMSLLWSCHIHIDEGTHIFPSGFSFA